MHLQTVKGKGYSRGWCGTPHTPLSQACCSNRFCMLPTMHRWVSFSDPMASGTLCFAHQGEFRTTLQAALQCADMTWQCGHCLRCMMHMAWKVSLLLACQLDAVLPALRSNLVCVCCTATMRSYPAIGDGTACLIVLLVISGPWFLVCHLSAGLSWQVVSNWDAG